MPGPFSDERPPVLTAQQTNLVRAVLDPRCRLDAALSREPVTGRKIVPAIATEEFSRFRSAWNETPVGCIRSMNLAIARLQDPARLSRYLEAAVDLELLMDREEQGVFHGRDLEGVPGYLADGYTDFGAHTRSAPLRPRQRIVVDKEKLRSGLVSAKRRAVEAMSPLAPSTRPFEAELRDLALALRNELGYREGGPTTASADDTVPLSQSIERHDLSCRHLSILFQLRLQESGVSSRLVKGTLRLFRLKLRHVWNIAEAGKAFALIDVSFADGPAPFVLAGSTSAEVYERAADRMRLYSPSPETSHRYQVRATYQGHGSGPALSAP